jgi:N6-adenosine-specific RNA methylase IME4
VGFSYRSCAVWDKEAIGPGYYFRQQHELLLVATKGSPPAPPPSARVSSIIRARRTRHSAKPPIVYTMIEKMYPGLPKLELFARGVERPGWSTWGNEADDEIREAVK